MRGFYRNTHSLPIQIALVQKTSLAKISLAKISFDIETHPWITSIPNLCQCSHSSIDLLTNTDSKEDLYIAFLLTPDHHFPQAVLYNMALGISTRTLVAAVSSHAHIQTASFACSTAGSTNKV